MFGFPSKIGIGDEEQLAGPATKREILRKIQLDQYMLGKLITTLKSPHASFPRLSIGAFYDIDAGVGFPISNGKRSRGSR